MDLQQLKQVIDLMKRADLTDFEIEEKDLKLRLRRETGKNNPPNPNTPPPYPVGNIPGSAAPLPTATPPGATTPTMSTSGDPGVKTINSPMVGTFYASASPDTPPLIAVGAATKPDTVVCIIEAMKVMNEIQAELEGTIVEVLVTSGTSVEFGQPLFKIKVV
ncbi:MAG: acetyl-CoA carboxylase biotin carboxyl carrier protein [Puniceicoccales bacterium]|nr:acetyl-CoA carboxylase biotin carboxyl carrier protein [Puniceicoccales bacterium]